MATPVTVKVKFKSESVTQFVERYHSDVSKAGIFIRTPKPLSVGTAVKFEFELQDGSPLMSGDGTVVWTRARDAETKSGPGMGVRFDNLPGSSKGVVDSVLDFKARAKQSAAGADAETQQAVEDAKREAAEAKAQLKEARDLANEARTEVAAAKADAAKQVAAAEQAAADRVAAAEQAAEERVAAATSAPEEDDPPPLPDQPEPTATDSAMDHALPVAPPTSTAELGVSKKTMMGIGLPTAPAPAPMIAPSPPAEEEPVDDGSIDLGAVADDLAAPADDADRQERLEKILFAEAEGSKTEAASDDGAEPIAPQPSKPEPPAPEPTTGTPAARTAPPPQEQKSSGLIWLVILVLLAGGGFLVWKMVMQDQSKQQNAPAPESGSIEKADPLRTWAALQDRHSRG